MLNALPDRLDQPAKLVIHGAPQLQHLVATDICHTTDISDRARGMLIRLETTLEHVPDQIEHWPQDPHSSLEQHCAAAQELIDTGYILERAR